MSSANPCLEPEACISGRKQTLTLLAAVQCVLEEGGIVLQDQSMLILRPMCVAIWACGLPFCLLPGYLALGSNMDLDKAPGK